MVQEDGNSEKRPETRKVEDDDDDKYQVKYRILNFTVPTRTILCIHYFCTALSQQTRNESEVL
jgi:hypothetical protein